MYNIRMYIYIYIYVLEIGLRRALGCDSAALRAPM